MIKVQSAKAFLYHGCTIASFNIQQVNQEKAFIISSNWNFNPNDARLYFTEGGSQVTVAMTTPLKVPLWKRWFFKPFILFSVVELGEKIDG